MGAVSEEGSRQLQTSGCPLGVTSSTCLLQHNTTYCAVIRAINAHGLQSERRRSGGTRACLLPPLAGRVLLSLHLPNESASERSPERSYVTAPALVHTRWHGWSDSCVGHIHAYTAMWEALSGGQVRGSWEVIESIHLNATASSLQFNLSATGTYRVTVCGRVVTGLQTCVSSRRLVFDDTPPSTGVVCASRHAGGVERAAGVTQLQCNSDGVAYVSTYQVGVSQILLRWRGFDDTESRIRSFLLGVGSSPGSADLVPWQFVGLATEGAVASSTLNAALALVSREVAVTAPTQGEAGSGANYGMDNSGSGASYSMGGSDSGSGEASPPPPTPPIVPALTFAFVTVIATNRAGLSANTSLELAVDTVTPVFLPGAIVLDRFTLSPSGVYYDVEPAVTLLVSRRLIGATSRRLVSVTLRIIAANGSVPFISMLNLTSMDDVQAFSFVAEPSVLYVVECEAEAASGLRAASPTLRFLVDPVAPAYPAVWLCDEAGVRISAQAGTSRVRFCLADVGSPLSGVARLRARLLLSTTRQQVAEAEVDLLPVSSFKLENAAASTAANTTANTTTNATANAGYRPSRYVVAEVEATGLQCGMQLTVEVSCLCIHLPSRRAMLPSPPHA